MNQYLIRYYYHASGMELGPDVKPEIVITADSMDMAVYIYRLIFWPESHVLISFNDWIKKDAIERNWGVVIQEVRL